jgi:hypothetical protein
MVAMLRLILLRTLGTKVVKVREVFVTLALGLPRIIVEVVRRTRVKELTIVEQAATKEKLLSIGVVICACTKTHGSASLEQSRQSLHENAHILSTEESERGIGHGEHRKTPW